MLELISRLEREHSLTESEYRQLVEGYTPELAEYAASRADRVRRQVYGDAVFVRGLIEISNICKNDCLYCGIRRSNTSCDRYRLTESDILDCCREGYGLGFRTFVLQGGEDGYYTDERVESIVRAIKSEHPDCAVTLSLGERSYDSYKRLFDAGADRYLLRHETADGEHYSRLHPSELTLSTRLECLHALKAIGYQVGCGFMVGSPYQSSEHIARDLRFIEKFDPDMCGIGPFIPHKDTPFRDKTAGSAYLTCFLLSIIRLMKPNILLPATTALGSIIPDGREMGLRAGANVVMPNLSPVSAREKYTLYNNKLHTGTESAQALKQLKDRIKAAGYTVVVSRGDIKKEQKNG
ncbi:MAG: [Clostridia bacterium]|nr:[FeFe] hydrogenase H-cluster radical SAM maturase HydE [Clostridia bacterium]